MGPKLGALAVLVEDGQVLLVRRGAGKADAGLWGFPGGHVEAGETVAEAAVRELREECCLRARAGRVLAHLDLIRRDAAGVLLFHYVLIAVLCEAAEGVLEACDDAEEAAWHPVGDVLDGAVPLSADVGRVLRLALAEDG